ncbi:MAG: HAMP domain-containing histidine kinase [Cyclobacteriaceae bacterium]|nr:HAMP domain-containing histidine kinase [Cyclobacteriaceae bacterium]
MMINGSMYDQDSVRRITQEMWKPELDRISKRYHVTVAWVAVLLDPVFAITDYFNIPASWQELLVIRLVVSFLTLLVILLRRKLQIPTYLVAAIPFLLISLQNAYVYKLVDGENLLGQNLNYMALLVGASMFVLWPWIYSMITIIFSAGLTFLCLMINPKVSLNLFFVNGGLLLMAIALFTIVFIQTRYTLVIREIRTRLALKASNEAIRIQAIEIKNINENLEQLVKERTEALQTKNKALEEAAFINAHKLRSPVASILGLVNLMKTAASADELREANDHLQKEAIRLDEIVSTIRKTIERGSSRT